MPLARGGGGGYAFDVRFEPPPFRPGEGPFTARGLVLRGYLESIDARTPGGLAAARAELADPAASAFFDRIFLASAYYDVGPLIQLVRVAARREGTPLPAFVIGRSRRGAQHDVATVYAPVLKTSSPEAMAERLPRIFERYFQPGKSELVEVRPGRMLCRFAGLPEPALDFYVWSNEGFVGQSLELAGAKGCRVAVVSEGPDGALAGVPMRAQVVEATWS